jgi:hypothetical protein
MRLPSGTLNLAVFLALIVHDPDTVEAKRAPFYEELARVVHSLREAQETAQKTTNRPQTAQNKDFGPENDPDPDFRGRGSYIERMAERAGFEPAMEFDPHTRLAGECLQPLGHLSLDRHASLEETYGRHQEVRSVKVRRACRNVA